jgi:hypothetical protein
MQITKEFRNFCYDWMIGFVPKPQLVKEFQQHGWDFEQFKSVAQRNTYWVPDMSILRYRK